MIKPQTVRPGDPCLSDGTPQIHRDKREILQERSNLLQGINCKRGAVSDLGGLNDAAAQDLIMTIKDGGLSGAQGSLRFMELNA